MPVRVLLIDDHDVVRAGLSNLLQRQHNAEIVGEASDGRKAVELVQQLSPDVVLMDIAMPGLNGLEATRQIRAADTGAKVIILSMHSDTQYVIEVLKAGASGYLLKNSVGQHLPLALKAAMDGKVYLSPEITGVVVDNVLRHTPAENRAIDVLTSREREVLQLLAEGKTSKEIATDLFISAKTVESHRAQIMEKLKLRTVAELTKFAIREGLTDLGS